MPRHVSRPGPEAVANHLKSKGNRCQAPDANDGQGNSNAVRVNGVSELLTWPATDPTGAHDPDVLLLGGCNSNANPIANLKTGGFTNLTKTFLGPDTYSYVLDGRWGDSSALMW